MKYSITSENRAEKPAFLAFLLVFVLCVVPQVQAADTAAGADLLLHPENTARAGLGLLPVSQPDLTGTEEVVQQTLIAARERVAGMLESADTRDIELANAYGELGELYQIHHFFRPAEPAYRNASKLAPKSFLWPYYLGYLMQEASELEKAEQSLVHALGIRPDYAPATLRLAQVYLDQNRPDQAVPLFEAVVDNGELRAAALYGLGKAALAQRDFETAAELLEKALEARPEATKIHYPLGMAYRGMGNVEKARKHISLHGGGEPEVVDPLVEDMNQLLTGGRTQLQRALEAVVTRKYPVAVEAFGKALEQDPGNVNLRTSYARSLFLSDKREEARKELEEAVRRDPANDLANFLLGVMLESEGKTMEAERLYRATLEADPKHSGANHYLGNIMMREGRYEKAAGYYRDTVAGSPENLPARLMEILALQRAGTDPGLMMERLREALREHPDDQWFSYIQARILAASPEDGLRDGVRALEISTWLAEKTTGPEILEVKAMSYAELGQFEKAIETQNSALFMAFSMGRVDLIPAMQTNLALYQQGKPCRRPWSDDSAIFQPIPIDPVGPFRDYPTGSPF